MFRPFDIVTAEETTLGGNFRPHEITRMNWETVEGHMHLDIGKLSILFQLEVRTLKRL